MKRSQKLIAITLCIVLFGLMFPVFSFGADSDFENSLSAFPKSYRAALRALHEKHPTWSFTAMKTGIDWEKAVDAESSGGRSLFPNYCTDLFKSVKSGDYNYSTGSYIQKDSGFVTANRLAVSYYMDPRNFLNETDIFQFEDLSYDESFNEAAVEYVLRGTFMYKAKISYYNTKGKLVNTNEKYSTVICEAGKENNVNPCYLAAKIRGEIGDGTSATSGKNSTYPGIFNFYNIGASDGAGAIERGLYWAKSGTTYSRPWNTPKKSIIGGAEFVASSYIAQGQHTTYLQKFNVNPDAAYNLYDHQYMTNVCAAAFQAYFSYDSYASAKLLDNKFSFSIPVFNNMDDQNGTNGKITLADASSLSGYIDTDSSVNVRTGPSTNNDRLDFYLPSGTNVTISDIVETDSTYYQNVLYYPFWYKISFTYQSKKYTGYVPKSFVTLSSSVAVSPGAYEPLFNGSKKLRLLSFNEQIATIDGDTINFLKKGTVEIAAYDSTGRFSIVKYNVTDAVAPAAVTNLMQSDTTTSSFTLSWQKSAGATGYTVYKYNSAKKTYTALKTTTATKYTVSPGSAGAVGTYAVKARKKVNGTVLMSGFSKSIVASTLPKKVSEIWQTATKPKRYTLCWNEVANADGYRVYKYDTEKKKYVFFKDTEENRLTVTGLKRAQTAKYKVRAFVKASGKTFLSAYSPEFEAITAPAVPTNVKAKKNSSSSYTLSWGKVKGAYGYRIFRLNKETNSYVAIATVRATSYKIKAEKGAKKETLIVKAFVRHNGKYFGNASTPVTVKLK